jgi:peptidyl-prolyl cis-trans isomerase C
VSRSEVGDTEARRGSLRPVRQRWMARARRTSVRVLKEPLLHFVVAGGILFAAGQLYQSETSVNRIVLTEQHVVQLGNDYALQFGTQPDARALDALIRRDIHDEILYREGLALKLDQVDEIVRRRVVQKMQFLVQDLNPPAEPTNSQLQAYYDAHADMYVIAPRATFSHIYFSPDKGGDVVAEARAKAVLASLPDQTTRAPGRGDLFPDLYDFSAYEPEQVERLFGHTPLLAAVYTGPLTHWPGLSDPAMAGTWSMSMRDKAGRVRRSLPCVMRSGPIIFRPRKTKRIKRGLSASRRNSPSCAKTASQYHEATDPGAVGVFCALGLDGFRA